MIKRIADISKELDDLREKGVQRGELTGFGCLDPLYSLKQGSYTIILGSPAHGKSEFIFELLLSQSEKYGKKHLVYSPETGSVAEIVAELVHKVTRKPFYKTNGFACDDREYYNALNWIDHHFLIVDSDEKAYSIQELSEYVLSYEKENKGEKIHCIMAEPYNEIRHDMKDIRQDLYIEELIGDIRRFCKKNNKHLFLSIHPAHQQLITKDGKAHYPMPQPREAAGGQALFRKAMTWITIWRPPVGLINEHGMPYVENEVVISIDKAKPKGVSVKGKTSLFFDWKVNRYFEDIRGNKFYAFDHEKGYSQLQPSKEFDLF